PMEPSLRIYERRAKHFEERRPCLQPGHGPRGARGEVGRGGHAREPGAPGMDGERKECKKPGARDNIHSCPIVMCYENIPEQTFHFLESPPEKLP
ncbi:hypothetical protein U0070_006144, partial [Myodes glareolus]